MAELVSGPKNRGSASERRTANQPSISTRRLRALIRQGSAAATRRDWRAAVWFYDLVIEASPSSLPIQVQLGHALKELGDFDSAGRNYHAVLEQRPEDDDLLLQIGHLEKLKGNPQKAAAYYRKAAELNPSNTDALVEYHALSARLGLPALPPLSGSVDQARVATAEQRTPVKQADDPLGQKLLRKAHRLSQAVLGPTPAANGPDYSRETVSRPKVLFASDSLGTPVHARGIYHYSIALVEILSDLGFEISLVVEKLPEYGLRRHTRRSGLSSAAIDMYQCAEIYRYFSNNIFSFRWKFPNQTFQKLVERLPLLVRIGQRIWFAIFPRYKVAIRNLSDAINFIPSRGNHLTKFDRFL
jgi:tetratricopeptide (TPR) repeat protein